MNNVKIMIERYFEKEHEGAKCKLNPLLYGETQATGIYIHAPNLSFTKATEGMIEDFNKGADEHGERTISCLRGQQTDIENNYLEAQLDGENEFQWMRGDLIIRGWDYGD